MTKSPVAPMSLRDILPELTSGAVFKRLAPDGSTTEHTLTSVGSLDTRDDNMFRVVAFAFGLPWFPSSLTAMHERCWVFDSCPNTLIASYTLLSTESYDSNCPICGSEKVRYHRDINLNAVCNNCERDLARTDTGILLVEHDGVVYGWPSLSSGLVPVVRKDLRFGMRGYTCG